MPDSSAPLLERVATARLPTAEADFTMTVLRTDDGKEHLVLALGELSEAPPPLVRLTRSSNWPSFTNRAPASIPTRKRRWNCIRRPPPKLYPMQSTTLASCTIRAAVA